MSWCVCVCVCVCVCYVWGLGSDDEVRLIETLFQKKGYNALIRPVRNLTETVTVKFGLAMIQLINVVRITFLFLPLSPPLWDSISHYELVIVQLKITRAEWIFGNKHETAKTFCKIFTAAKTFKTWLHVK